MTRTDRDKMLTLIAASVETGELCRFGAMLLLMIVLVVAGALVFFDCETDLNELTKEWNP